MHIPPLSSLTGLYHKGQRKSKSEHYHIFVFGTVFDDNRRLIKIKSGALSFSFII